MSVLLITPPLTQLNTPYPATVQLMGYLKKHDIDAFQADLSIELIAKIFTKSTLTDIFTLLSEQKPGKQLRFYLSNADFYAENIDSIMHFLSGNDHSLAMRFSNPDYWPKTKRWPHSDDLEWAFGTIGQHDKATHLCTLALKDLAEMIQTFLDPNFELIRYAESICMHLPEFAPLNEELQKPYSFVDKLLIDILKLKIEDTKPEFVGLSVPFPGNLYSALRCAQWLKKHHPNIKIIVGGGYVNTELRQISDTTLFDYIDFLVFDDGELPLHRILTNGKLVRTIFRDNAGNLNRDSFDSRDNIPFSQLGIPDYSGLIQNNYINLIELANPMHALWSNGRWNKLTLAHGCYWSKCAFCDGSLDYIKRFEMASVDIIVDRMEAIMKQTGISGFHFTDEAAPPVVLRKLALEIIKRGLVVSYWTNVRFEKSYDSELCYLLAKSGCIAVSGGLEVASPRILALINKGITIETARDCMKNMSDAGILIHAYLMYGFPSQTEKETIDSLQVVRNLFADNYLHSAFWHRYAMTIHSPSGIQPSNYGAKRIYTTPNSFANNEVAFTTKPNPNLEALGTSLRNATYNYMHGTGFDIPVSKWFE